MWVWIQCQMLGIWAPTLDSGVLEQDMLNSSA